MTERMVEVRLGGYLGRKYGRSHKFLVSKSSEALKALYMQVKGVKEAIRNAHSKGVVFAVFQGKHNIRDTEELEMGCKDVVRIVPVYAGSKKAGALQTIIGVVLVVVGAVMVAFGVGFGVPVMQAGVAMAVGGVVQLLSPGPKGLKTKEDAGNMASYAFGGPVNTAAQGNPIPLFYGEREVGGAVISAGILAEDQA